MMIVMHKVATANSACKATLWCNKKERSYESDWAKQGFFVQGI